MWMEEGGEARINDTRFAEAEATGADDARGRLPLLLRDARRRRQGQGLRRCAWPTSPRSWRSPPSARRSRKLPGHGPAPVRPRRRVRDVRHRRVGRDRRRRRARDLGGGRTASRRHRWTTSPASCCSDPRSTSSTPTSSPSSTRLRDLTLDALERGIPFLGICFGAQVAAWALDAPIAKAPVREVGYVPIHPTAGARGGPRARHLRRRRHGLPVAHGHLRRFRRARPCSPPVTTSTNQAFRLATGELGDPVPLRDRPRGDRAVGRSGRRHGRDRSGARRPRRSRRRPIATRPRTRRRAPRSSAGS